MKTKTSLKPPEIKLLKNPVSTTVRLDEAGIYRIIMIYDMEDGHYDHIFRLTEEGVSLELLIVYIGRNQDAVKINLLIEHLAPHTKANVSFKAILFDRGKVDFSGNLKLPSIAQKSDTFLKCDTLLLSQWAKSKTIPSLEVIANDVKAGHSASAGRPDEDTLFYLQTRGFSQKAAYKLLIEAFIAGALKTFSSITGFDEAKLKKEILSRI